MRTSSSTEKEVWEVDRNVLYVLGVEDTETELWIRLVEVVVKPEFEIDFASCLDMERFKKFQVEFDLKEMKRSRRARTWLLPTEPAPVVCLVKGVCVSVRNVSRSPGLDKSQSRIHLQVPT